MFSIVNFNIEKRDKKDILKKFLFFSKKLLTIHALRGIILFVNKKSAERQGGN